VAASKAATFCAFSGSTGPCEEAVEGADVGVSFAGLKGLANVVEVAVNGDGLYPAVFPVWMEINLLGVGLSSVLYWISWLVADFGHYQTTCLEF
jgi:hypothetical protein